MVIVQNLNLKVLEKEKIMSENRNAEIKKAVENYEKQRPAEDKLCASAPEETEFDKFKRYFLSWKQRLGLQSWKILNFEERPYKESRAYATINYIPEQRECWVYFYGSENDPAINVSDRALHEVLHLLLADCNVSDAVLHTIINTVLDLLHDKTIHF
jgi:hypothetical protein